MDKTIKISYNGVPLIVEGWYTPKQGGDRDVPPVGLSFEIYNVFTEDWVEIPLEIFDGEKLDNIVYEKLTENG